MQLLDCLLHTPVRTLQALCQANGFACPAPLAKAELAAWLHGRLASRCRASYLAQLPHDQLAILHALAQQPAPWPLPQFEVRFGQIRRHRPWRQDEPRYPWRAPVSVAEALVYRGLIFVIKTTQQAPHVVLPAEIAQALRQPLPDAPPFAPNPPLARALLDLALLLAYVQQAEVRPLHGRWLSPQHCQRLGACLAPPLPAGRLPSQRHSPRLAFAHYLAERLQLVTVAAGLLKPSPAAFAWLEQSADAQLSACWQAWLAPDDANRDLWRRFHLPGHTLRDPTGFARRLIDRLALASWGDLSDLLPWWERQQTHDQMVQDLLHGPLAGLAVLPDEGDLSAAQPPALTAIGAWLAAGHPAPVLPAPQPLVVNDGDATLDLPTAAPPLLAALLALAPWTDLEPGPRLRFTPASLARAIGQGRSLPGLWALCQRFVDPPLDQSLVTQLQAWAAQQRWVELRPALLLAAPSPADLDALWADRAVRQHLAQRLAGDQASIRSAEPERLRRALTARGYAVRVRSAVDPVDTQQALPAAGDAWWLYTAGLTQRLLAERLGHPALPGAILSALQATLGPAELEAAQAAASAASAVLEAALEEPPDLAPRLPPDQIEQLLLDAIRRQNAVQMLYWSPWQNETTQRRVQPLALQWRGDHRYLIAHCHSANAQRTFRLDRILDLTPCPPPSTP